MLHLLLSADSAAWQDCSACCSAEDTVVLLGEAVMRLGCGGAESGPGFPCRMAVSAPDARARGLSDEMAGEGVELIGDAGLLSLIEAHRHCLSWR